MGSASNGQRKMGPLVGEREDLSVGEQEALIAVTTKNVMPRVTISMFSTVNVFI